MVFNEPIGPKGVDMSSPEEYMRGYIASGIPMDAELTGDTNPKKRHGDLKAPLGLIPKTAMEQMAWVLKLGADKYGAWNWRKEPIDAMTYVHAIMRHTQQWKEGEDKDEESEQNHLAHIMACCALSLDAMEHGKFVDNRPPHDKPLDTTKETL